MRAVTSIRYYGSVKKNGRTEKCAHFCIEGSADCKTYCCLFSFSLFMAANWIS